MRLTNKWYRVNHKGVERAGDVRYVSKTELIEKIIEEVEEPLTPEEALDQLLLRAMTLEREISFNNYHYPHFNDSERLYQIDKLGVIIKKGLK